MVVEFFNYMKIKNPLSKKLKKNLLSDILYSVEFVFTPAQRFDSLCNFVFKIPRGT